MAPMLVLAAFALIAVMGVTVLTKEEPKKALPAPVTSYAVQPAPVVAQPVVAAKPPSPVRGMSRELRTIEQTVKGWDLDRRGADFEDQRVQALSGLSDLRERLDAYLTKHDDDRADSLWDRLQRVYVMVKKL